MLSILHPAGSPAPQLPAQPDSDRERRIAAMVAEHNALDYLEARDRIADLEADVSVYRMWFQETLHALAKVSAKLREVNRSLGFDAEERGYHPGELRVNVNTARAVCHARTPRSRAGKRRPALARELVQ